MINLVDRAFSKANHYKDVKKKIYEDFAKRVFEKFFMENKNIDHIMKEGYKTL